MRRRAAFGLLLLVVIFTAFWPAVNANFLTLDDEVYLTNNPLVDKLSPETVRRIFLSQHEDLYKPLTFLSYAIEYTFFGMNPRVYHVTNLLLHALNAILAWRWLRLVGVRRAVAAAAALLFAVHPLRVESVLWISERKDLLSALFCLGSLIFYTLYTAQGRLRDRAISLGLFVLSLLAKPTAVLLPVVFLVMDHYRGIRVSRSTLWAKAPFFVVSSVFIVSAIQFAKNHESLDLGQIFYVFFTPAYSVLFYCVKTVLPLALNVAYSDPRQSEWFMAFIYYASPVILGAAIGLAVRKRLVQAQEWAGLSLFVLFLAPTLQLIPTRAVSLVNDHYTYLPSIGLMWAAAAVADRLIRSPRVSLAVLVSVSLAWSGLTYARSMDWQDDLKLWSSSAKLKPDHSMAYAGLARHFSNKHQHAEAVKQLDRAIELRPDWVILYNNRGFSRMMIGDLAGALRDFNKALELDPTFTLAVRNRQRLYRVFRGIIRVLDQQIASDPADAAPRYNRANVYADLRLYDKALSDYDAAIRLRPDWAAAYNNRGTVWEEKGDIERARQDYRRAVAVEPGLTAAQRNLMGRNNP